MITRAYFFGQAVPVRNGLQMERIFRSSDLWSITETEAGDIRLERNGEVVVVRDAPVALTIVPDATPEPVEARPPAPQSPPAPQKRRGRSAG